MLTCVESIARARLSPSLSNRTTPIPHVAEQLESLRQRIAARNESDTPAEYLQRLAITQTGDAFNLDFYGDCFDESYDDLLNTLALPVVAASVRSLILRGPDEGANGTRNWDIEPLLATDATFPQLETFSVQLSRPADHNRSIIGSVYEEDGILARLLAKSPRILELTVPSAPSAAFFDVGQRPIRFLSVDAGYDTQDFISNLAKSSCFPSLQSLEWGEYHETYMDDYVTHCTPKEHYQELFRSNAFGPVTRFVWRNPICNEDEIAELKSVKPSLQLLVVRYSDEYA
ncbi:MAG: hypothetical protein JNK90_22090 [Planctomycetaceae bacterium]|nr:hypothetical protein [Planctomycetaceae bacterium]